MRGSNDPVPKMIAAPSSRHPELAAAKINAVKRRYAIPGEKPRRA